ncbi:sialate O-acetylesterase [Olivibacter domesticus]|uniref:Sialate O-acetylesterase n=1 Tax=Olivibacter domesticus TaxID=407022 RepID=A0A1H7GDB1_OLID1|nr:sialate O-acetylesterase [Olivibacter domesticus]SEK34832.1 sialate O-acetylesterase [Olivibacter domesticus]
MNSIISLLLKKHIVFPDQFNYLKKQWLFTAFLVFAFGSSFAQTTVNSLFSDHMVLQQNTKIPVWGTSSSSNSVKVKFNGQEMTAKVTNGKWMATLQPMPVAKNGLTMEILADDTIRIHDILIGEVWLCSGQSNMERQLGPRPPQRPIENWENERDKANYPLIREFYVPRLYAKSPQKDAFGKWRVCSPTTVVDFSGVGYFFAEKLYKQLNVPIGILFSAFGGTPAEDWTSRAALENNPELNKIVKNYVETMKADYKPRGQCLSGLYNGMIYPLLPFAIKGVAWYQGESNNSRAAQYQSVLSNMIKNWRQDFKQGDFPFLIVQIAPNKNMKPELREAQRLVVEEVPNTALIVTTDCGDADDIHPTNKRPVGERLALAANALGYHGKNEYRGPVCKSHEVKGNKLYLYFEHIGAGLVAGRNKGQLQGFEIAGADGNYRLAEAVVQGSAIVLSSPHVQEPKSARYGWDNVPDVNLYNSEGLPASPFIIRN